MANGKLLMSRVRDLCGRSRSARRFDRDASMRMWSRHTRRQATPRTGGTDLKAAMGTASSDFVSQTLFQLQTAARLPNGGISEIAVNAALSMNPNP